MVILVDEKDIPEGCATCQFEKRNPIYNDIACSALERYGYFATSVYEFEKNFRPSYCPYRSTEVTPGLYDIVEEYDDCHIQILKNSLTGQMSIGWWKNDSPPGVIPKKHYNNL